MTPEPLRIDALREALQEKPGMTAKPQKEHTMNKEPSHSPRTPSLSESHWLETKGSSVPVEYPPHLIKACCDEFVYAVRLSTGELWYFREATVINSEWVRLTGFDKPGEMYSYETNGKETNRPIFDRGVDVRVSSIVWVAAAPHGS